MSMEPGTLIRVHDCGRHSGSVFVGVGTDNGFWITGGTVGIIVSPHYEVEDRSPPNERSFRRSFMVLIGGRQGWLWEDEIEVIDEAR